jgi:hypothetical protein
MKVSTPDGCSHRTVNIINELAARIGRNVGLTAFYQTQENSTTEDIVAHFAVSVRE